LKKVAIESIKKNLLRNIRQGNQVGRQKKPVTRVARELRQSTTKLLLLWQLLITKTNSSMTSKSLSRISSEDHKRT